MIESATALPVAHPHVGTILRVGAPTGECVAAFRDYYGAHFVGDPTLRIAVSKDGPYALVSWEAGASGGMDLFRRLDSTWCRIAVTGRPSDARGSFTPTAWLTPRDIAGFDELDAARARRLFDGPFVTQTLHVRSRAPSAPGNAAAQPRPKLSATGSAHVQ